MPTKKLSKKEILDNFPETVKYLKRKGAARMMISDRGIVLFSEKGSSFKSLDFNELDQLEKSLK